MKFPISKSMKCAFHYRILFEIFSARDEEGCLAFEVRELSKGTKAFGLVTFNFVHSIL